MLGYVMAGQHVGHGHLERRNDAASGGWNVSGSQRRAVAGLGHRVEFRLGDMQDFKPVHDDTVAGPQKTKLARMLCTLADLRRCYVLEIIFQKREYIATF